MTCSLETYRARIGTFQSCYIVKKHPCKTPNTSPNGNQPGTYIAAVYIVLLMSNYYIINTKGGEKSWQDDGDACRGYHGPSTGTTSSFSVLSLEQAPVSINIHIWDPGINRNQYSGVNHHTRDCSTITCTPSVFSRMSPTELNKLAHITNGNRGKRGKGINCLYWNKGPAFLCNHFHP